MLSSGTDRRAIGRRQGNGALGAISLAERNDTLLQGELDEVLHLVAIDFRRPLATETEINDEQDAWRTSDDAGVTVICNDGVVTLNDNGRLTG
jgi:hypothetical protein